MPTFIIDGENQIRMIGSEEQVSEGASDAFTTKQEPDVLAGKWPGGRLVEIWNRVPGVKPIKRFTDRKTAIDRIWKAIQPLAHEVGNTSGPALGVPEATRPTRTQKPRRNKTAVLKLQKVRAGSKKAEIFKLLHRPDGVTLQDLMAATGWQDSSRPALPRRGWTSFMNTLWIRGKTSYR